MVKSELELFESFLLSFFLSFHSILISLRLLVPGASFLSSFSRTGRSPRRKRKPWSDWRWTSPVGRVWHSFLHVREVGLVSSSEPHHTPLHRTGASRDEGERQPRWRVELIPLSFTPPTVASAEGDDRRWVGFGLSLSFDPSPHRNRP